MRERVSAGVVLRGAAAPDRVVLFVHGAGTPAEVAFDTPIGDHSWMAYLARGRLRRVLDGHDRLRPFDAPGAHERPLQPGRGAAGAVHPQPHSGAVHSRRTPGQLTSLGSDWHDIDAVVDHIRTLRGVAKVSLVAWSLGGPRAGGYAAQHPEKVHRMVLFAPAYNRAAAATAPALPNPGRGLQHAVAQRVHRQLGSPGGLRRQYEPAVRDAVWAEMLASDPVGRHLGHRRAPRAVHDHLGLEPGGDRRHEDPRR